MAGDTGKTRRDSGISRDVANSIRPKTRPNFSRIGKAIRGRRGRVGRGKNGRLQGDTGSDYYDGNEDDGVNPWDEDYQEAMDALRQAEQGGNAGNDRLGRYLNGDDSDGDSDGGGSDGSGDLDGSGDGGSGSSLDETGKEGLDGTEENGSGDNSNDGDSDSSGSGNDSDGDSGKKSGLDDEDDANEDRRDAAANELNNAEEAEAKRGGSHDQNAAEGEQVGHTSNVTGKGKDGGKGGSKSKDKGKGKGRFRGAKKSPIVTILISLLMSFGGMMLSQAALPFTAQDKINEDVDVINTSTVQRTVVFMRTIQDTIRYSQLPVNIDNPSQHRIRTGSNIFGNEVFLPSLRMRRNLKKQGIKIPRFGKNRGNMVFTDGNGITKVITPAQYQQEYENNKHFRAAIDEGSKRWKFSISAFRDKIFKFLLDKLRLNKLPFVGYIANQDKDGKKARQQSSENAQEATTWRNNTKFVEGKDSSGKTKISETAGKISGSLANVSARISKIASKVGSILSISCAISGFINNIRQMLVGFAQSPIGLLAMDFLSGVDQARAGDSDSSPINALGRNLVEEQWTEYLDYDGYEETEEDEDGIGYAFIDSAKMGDEDNVKFKVTYQKRSAAQSQAFVNAFNEDAVITRPDKGTERFNPSTAINAALKRAQESLSEQPGFMASMASTAVSLLSGDDSSTLMSVMNTMGVTDYKRCTQFQEIFDYAMIAADLLTIGSITADIISVVFAPEFSWAALGSTVVTIGLREAWSLIKQELMRQIQNLAQYLIELVTPKITEYFKSFIMTEAFGQDLGTSIASGAQMINGKNAQAGGMLLTSPSGYQSELDARDKINAERAKSERLARNPFDYTSQYTFAGSLASAIIPVTLQSESVFGAFSNFGNLVTKSVASLVPRTSAINNMVNSQKVKDIEAYNNKYCKELAHINALGDAYCNPIFTTDLDTLNSKIEIKGNENEYGELGYDPIDDDYNSAFRVMERVALSGSFEELTGDDLFAIRDYMAKRDQGKLTMQDKINGNPLHHVENPTIAKNSDLANYIQYCGNRESVFGSIDANIAGDLQEDIGRLNYIPLYGSIKDIGNQNAVQENYDYIQGSACHMKNNPNTKLIAERSWNKDMYNNEDKDGDGEGDWPGFASYVDTYLKSGSSSYEPITYATIRDFSRYLEDQRYGESAGWVEKSAGTAYIEKYYEENPLDTSLYGTIARISGLSKEQVDDTFEFMALLEFQDEYDPSEFAPVLVAKEEEPTFTLEEDQIVEDAATVAIIYLNVLERGEDARERNFATA